MSNKETINVDTSKIYIKRIILATLIYVFTIFPITAIWHVGIFQELYLEFGYFNVEETFLNGIVWLLNIFIQGFVLALLWDRTNFKGNNIIQGLKFSWIIFVFYFSIQVVNFVVRKEIINIPYFITMETIYMIIQFSIYGLLMGKFIKPNTKK